MRRFIAKTDGPNRLGLRKLCETWCNDQWWVAAHMTPEQVAESLLDCFKRAARQELELLEVECLDVFPSPLVSWRTGGPSARGAPQLLWPQCHCAGSTKAQR
jgi:hypothetical protein